MTRAFDVIDNHTTVVNNLHLGGWVLDAGARGFDYARALAARGCRVVSLDPDPEVEDPQINGVQFLRAGLAAKSGRRTFELKADPSARRLIRTGASGGHFDVDCFDISDLSARVGADVWDAVKLNIEGEEYDILASWPGPVARQIVVSFHQHTDYKRPESEVDAIVRHLSRWYEVIRHEKDERYCAGANFWDSVFLLHEETAGR